MDLHKKQMALFIWLAVTPLLVVPIECPWKCKCTNYKTWCDSASLNGIPSSPSNKTEFLEIKNDNITKLSRDQFQNKGLGSLTELILVHTHTTHIEDTAFQDLIHLTDLIIKGTGLFVSRGSHIQEILPRTFHNLSKLTCLVLSRNKLETLPSHAFEEPSKIRNLDLSNNKIRELAVDMFYSMLRPNISHLHPLQISTLDLKRNYIGKVTPGTFHNMPHFTHLYLQKNKIEVLKKDSFFGLSGLRKLDVSYNPMNYIEEGAFKGLSSLSILRLEGTKLRTWNDNIFNGLIHLSELYFGTSYLENENNYTFASLKSLTCFVMQPNTISIIRRETFQNMAHLEVLDLNYNSINFIEGNSFQDLHYLTDLKLRRNYINMLSASVFSGLTNLKTLDLISNRISNIEADTFKEQSFLTRLYLNNNSLTSLSKKQFYGLISLKILFLNGNKISHIDVNAFYHLKALKVLALQYNKISYINDGTFRHLYRLDELYMTGNRMFNLQSHTFEGIMALKKLSLNTQPRNKINAHSNLLALEKDLYIHSLNIYFFFENINVSLSGESTAFSSCNIIAPLSEFLKKIIGLKYISFHRCKINIIGLYRGAVKPLYSLHLYKAKLTHLESNMFEDLVSLEVLSIVNSNISVVHPNTFTRNLKLKELDLSENKVSTLSLSSLNVTSLQNLILRACNINYVSPLTFSGVPNLLYLNLAENNLMTNTTQFGSLNKIKELDLSSNYLTELNKAMFQEMKFLEELNIRFNQISVVEEDTFLANKLLRTIDLSGNTMLIIYSNFMNFPSIQNLYLRNCNISTFPTLSNSVSANLITLNLEQNNLTKTNFEFFSGLRNLKNLSLGRNPIPCNCQLRPLIQDFKRNKYKYLGLEYLDCEGHHDQVCKLNNQNLLCGGRDYVKNSDIYFANLECNTVQLENETEQRDSTTLQSVMKYVEVVILGIMFLTGVLGNIILILIFLLHPEVRTFANAPILNLAIADLLSLVFNLALSFTDNLSRSWKLGLTLCKVFTAVRDLIVGASVYSVVSLSLQRYNATIQFNRQRGLFGLSDRVIIIMLIVSVWIMAFCFAVPAFISATVETRCLYVSSEYGEEYIRRTWTYQLLVYCVLPACIITYFYIKTARQLKESVRNYPGEIQATPQTQRRLRSANIVIVLTVMFCVSYGPNFLLRVLTAWSVLDSRSDSMTYISFVTYCLFFSNTCLNPIALYKMSSAFRPLFRRYILFWRCCKINAITQIVENSKNPPIGLQVASSLQKPEAGIPTQSQVDYSPNVLDTRL